MIEKNSREFTVPEGELQQLYEQTRTRTSKYWKLFPVLG